MHFSYPHRCITLVAVCICCVIGLVAHPREISAGGMKLGDLCRLKGQETNTLQGLGLVVGLRGTGDGDSAPTSRALARMMQLMGGPMSVDAVGNLNVRDVEDAKNVAMVFVTAKLPPVGAVSVSNCARSTSQCSAGSCA